MRRLVLATVALGLVACQVFGPPRSSDSGGDDSSAPTKKTSTPTPGPTDSPSPAPTVAPQFDPALKIGSNLSAIRAGALRWTAIVTAAVSGGSGDPSGTGPAAISLHARVARFPMAHANGMVVVTGGLNDAGSIIDTFATASVDAFGSWATASLPIRVCDQGLTVDQNGNFVMMGGVKGTTDGNEPTNAVFVGRVDSKGALSWSPTAVLPYAIDAFGYASASGKHYVVGGIAQTATRDVLVGTSAADGGVSWSVVPNALPEARYGGASFVRDNKLYLVGGLPAPNGAVQTKVYMAALGDGVPGVFAEAGELKVGDLPVPRAFMQVYIDKNGKLVIVGGNQTGGADSGTQKSVLVGTFASDGKLTFESGKDFSGPIQHYGLALTADLAILAGGTSAGEKSGYSNSLFAQALNAALGP